MATAAAATRAIPRITVSVVSATSARTANNAYTIRGIATVSAATITAS
jgi:hypothetical protein